MRASDQVVPSWQGAPRCMAHRWASRQAGGRVPSVQCSVHPHAERGGVLPTPISVRAGRAQQRAVCVCCVGESRVGGRWAQRQESQRARVSLGQQVGGVRARRQAPCPSTYAPSHAHTHAHALTHTHASAMTHHPCFPRPFCPAPHACPPHRVARAALHRQRVPHHGRQGGPAWS